MAKIALRLIDFLPLPDAAHVQRLKLVCGLVSVVSSSASCTFDQTTRVAGSPLRERSNATIFWSPPDVSRQMVGAAQRADAGTDSGDSAPSDAGALDSGMRAPAAEPEPRSGPQDSGAAGRSGEPAAGAPARTGALDAGASMSCSAGRYDGTFEGSVTFLQGSLTGIKGSIRATMALDPAGDYLRIREGNVTGVNDQGVKMNSGWTGALNCQTGLLENAELTDGTWDNGSRFSGGLIGMYALPTQSLAGTWQVQSDELVFAGGNGTWSMRRSEAQ